MAAAAVFSLSFTQQAQAQDGKSLFGVTSASVTYGLYARVDLGGASLDTDDAYWESPGYPSDPRVFFDIDADNVAFGGIGAGFDWMNGFRGDVSLLIFGESDFDGSWSSTQPATPGPHADVRGSISSTAVMATGYYSPLEYAGRNSKVQPFLSAGLGVARNKMGDWTRINATSTSVERTFNGDYSTHIAWSLGAGVAAELKGPGNRPFLLEASYRYFDLGTAKGGSTPLPGNGSSEPVTPLRFENRDHVISLSLRIPLRRY
ncbi:outer membrane protein [Actibacterium sp. D379-3]